MNLNNFTIKAQEAIKEGMEIATAKQNQSIEPTHLLKGMLLVDENVVPYLLRKLNVNPDRLSKGVDKLIDSFPKVVGGEQYFGVAAHSWRRGIPPHHRWRWGDRPYRDARHSGAA